MGGENFPVALRFLPREPKQHLANVYTYARFVDDVGDTASGDRGALLDLVDAELTALLDGRATLPPVRGLAMTVRECRIPLDPFRDLIRANQLDQRVTRYATFDELLGYCSLSATPVGRIVLHIAAAATPGNIADSDAVCSALQVLEHCQDVGEDARAGRIYLPTDDLSAAGVADEALLEPTTSPALCSVIAANVERAEQLMQSGRPLVRRLSGWARVAVAGYLAGGEATAASLRRHDYNVLARDIRPSRLGTVARVARLLAKG